MTKLVLSSSNKRGALSSSMPVGAAALRAKFGGGSSMPVRSMVRGSTGWLRNRDAIASAQDPQEHRPTMRATARFERRTSTVDALKQKIEQLQQQQQQQAAVEPSPPSAPKDEPPPRKKAKSGKAEKAVRPPEIEDGLSDMERLAYETWHLSDRELELAGHDPALVRAPAVLDAVRARFLHSPNIMLNSNFVCNFSVDQGAFKRILCSKYRFKTTYLPMNYPGMCCHFLLRRGVPLDRRLQPGYCDPEDRELGEKSAAFGRKYVTATFILFRTGNAFLRGSFSEEVMQFVYAQFKRILVDEYPHICTRYTCPDAKDTHSVVKTRLVYFSLPDDDGDAIDNAAFLAAVVKMEQDDTKENEAPQK